MTIFKAQGVGMGKGTSPGFDTNDLLTSAYATDMARAVREVQRQGEHAGFQISAVDAAQSVRNRHDAGDPTALPNYSRAVATAAALERNNGAQ